MGALDSLEEIFQDARNYSTCLGALITVATALGALRLTFLTVKFLLATIRGFRLYVLSQICCNSNTRKYGEWVVVTGATDGIGQAMAKNFARRGHSVIIVGRNEEKLERTKALIESEPNVGQVETIKIDLSDSSLENYERIKDQLDADNRDIGILVNNAGVLGDKLRLFVDHDLQICHDIINVNVMATVHFARLILPGMINRRRGLVLNVSSIAGSTAAPTMALYGVSKTFINQFSRVLEAEYASRSIDIINIEPGPVLTKLVKYASRSRASLAKPTPDDYAKSTLNAISTRISRINGVWPHAIMGQMTIFFEKLGLMPTIFKMLMRIQERKYSTAPPSDGRKQS